MLVLVHRLCSRLLVISGTLALVLVVSGPASAQSTTSITAITDELDQTGRYIEPRDSSEIQEAVLGLNGQGVAFVWLEGADDAEVLAGDLMLELDERRSRYNSVLVLTDSGVFGESFSADLRPAAAAAFDAFSRGAVADGIDTFAATLSGRTNDPPTTTTSEPNASSGSTGGGGGIPGWIWGAVVALLGFLGFRYFRSKRNTKKAESELLELDRHEVKAQLRDNADRVMELGDKVIAKNAPDLISTYEEASRTYTEVSSEVEGATSIEAMNRLDDRLDHAEWQFEVIEASLEGRTPPTAPAPEPEPDDVRPGPTTPATRQQPPAPTGRGDEPVLGPDDSIFGGQRRTSRPRYRAPQRRSGAGFGGGGLGSILGSIVLGGGLGRPRTSRRTQQRRASTGSFGGSRGGGGFGGLGGGVLRRDGGASNPRPSRRGAGGGGGGGGSFGRRSGRGGGGRF